MQKLLVGCHTFLRNIYYIPQSMYSFFDEGRSQFMSTFFSSGCNSIVANDKTFFSKKKKVIQTLNNNDKRRIIIIQSK